MKSKLVMILVFLFLPVISHGGQKEKLAAELIILSEVNKVLDQLRLQVVRMTDQLLGQQAVPEEYAEELQGFQKELLGMIFSELSWSTMKDDCIRIYAEVFSKEELETLVEFYRSLAGRSMVRKQPELMQKTLAAARVKIQDLLPRIEKMTRDFKDLVKGR